MCWLLMLPFRIFFGILSAVFFLPFAILALPFLLLKLLVRAIVAIAVLPFVILAVVAGIVLALVGAAFALVVPLLPFLFVGFCVWLLMRNSRAASAVRG